MIKIFKFFVNFYLFVFFNYLLQSLISKELCLLFFIVLFQRMSREELNNSEDKDAFKQKAIKLILAHYIHAKYSLSYRWKVT